MCSSSDSSAASSDVAVVVFSVGGVSVISDFVCCVSRFSLFSILLLFKIWWQSLVLSAFYVTSLHLSHYFAKIELGLLHLAFRGAGGFARDVGAFKLV